MHELAETALSKKLDCSNWIGQVFNGHAITAEMAATSQVYVDFVNDLPGFKLFEAKVSLEEVIDDCFGTADCIALRNRHLTVVDLKTGAGVAVDAEENTQLMCYGLGAFLKFDSLYDFEKITLVIVQPPLDNISTWTIDRDRMLQFAEELRQAKKLIDERPDLFVLSEKGCRWCASKAQCPEQRRLAVEAAKTDFSALSVGDLSLYLELIPHLKQFIEAVESKAKDALLSGTKITGWKVVEGRKTRIWKNPEQTVQVLTEKGYASKIYSQPELLSVAQMEKALKKEPVDLSELIDIKHGNPTLAKDSDNRQEINKAATAANDFASVQ